MGNKRQKTQKGEKLRLAVCGKKFWQLVVDDPVPKLGEFVENGGCAREQFGDVIDKDASVGLQDAARLRKPLRCPSHIFVEPAVVFV